MTGVTEVKQVDMWPDGFCDDARTSGPHWSTPILQDYRVASKHFMSHPSQGRSTLAEGLSAPIAISARCVAPIATPCRALVKRHNETSTTPAAPRTVEQTVLEELFANEGERFCLDTWTLIETLEEHFASVSSGGSKTAQTLRRQASDRSDEAPSSPQDRRLSLPDLVPVSTVQQLEGRLHPFAYAPPATLREERLCLGGMAMPFGGSDLLQLLRCDVELHSLEALSAPGRQDRTSIEAAIDREGSGLVDAKLVCYTDGSYYPPSDRAPERAGWAVIFIAPLLQKGAWIAGAVPALDPQDNQQLSAYTAECCALAIAHLYTALRFAHCAVVYKSDCQAAVGIVQGIMSHQKDPFARVLANAVAFRAAIAQGRDRAEYVPGHAGTFFNELADSLAKQGTIAGNTGSSPIDSVLSYWMCQGGTRLAWAGVFLQRLLGNPTLPPFDGTVGNDAWHAGLSGQQLIAPFIPTGCLMAATSTADVRCHRTLALVVISYNTLSLGASLEEADGAGINNRGLQHRPGRAALLAEQLHAKGATIAALQETRGQEGRTRIGKFLRYSSGAAHGQYGTELWLHTERPLMYGTSPAEGIFFNEAQIVVVHRDPRRVIIRFQVKSWRLLIASLHAPHRANEAHIISDWWKDTRHLLHKFANAAFVIVAGDVNASVGSFMSPSVGPTAAEPEDLPGQHWHTILRSLECWLHAPLRNISTAILAHISRSEMGKAADQT